VQALTSNLYSLSALRSKLCYAFGKSPFSFNSGKSWS
jgi:hypothetical protein